MPDVKISIQRIALSSDIASPYTDVTEADFGTVKAAIVIAGNASVGANPNPAAGAMSIGFYVNGIGQCCGAVSSTNTLEASATYRLLSNSLIASFASSVTMAAYTMSNITNGVRFTMTTDATTEQRYATIIMFGGADVSAHCNYFIPGTSANLYADVSGLGFRPQILFHLTTAVILTNSTSQNILSLGVTKWQNGPLHRACMISDATGQPTMVTYTQMSEIYDLCQFFAGGLSWASYTQYMTNDGFRQYTATGSTGSDASIYLALDLGGYNVGVFDFTTPTTIGTQSLTGFGFKPSHVLGVLGKALAYDVVYDDAVMSVGASDGTTESSISFASKDNVANSNISNYSKEQFVHLINATTSGDLVNGTINSLDDDGLTVNYSTVSATNGYRGFLVAFQTEDDLRQIGTADNRFLLIEP